MSIFTSSSTRIRRGFSDIVWRWRVVDIVVASVIAVACAVVFLLWNVGYEAPSALLKPLLPGLQGLLAGPWLVAGVLGGLIIRKPGAALYTELVAAVISALVGNQWGPLTIVSGLVQGLGAELVFLLFAYAVWRLPVAILAGAGAGLACGINDRILWYAGADTTFTIVYIVSTTISGAVIAGAGSWFVARGLAATGALNRFASGREALGASEVSGAVGAVAPAAVEARGWGWRYATRHKWAVQDASFRIEPGERVLLLGASGSGKSTLLHGLAGVLGGDDEGEQTGALLIDGEPAARARGRAGMVLQDPDSQAILARVGDDVAFGCENLAVPRDEIWPRVRAALDAVGLDVALDRSTSALSGGQKQRLALAGVLAMRPGVILLDEPTANLDPAGVAEVRDAVRRALDATGATLVVVEHRLDVWLPLVDRVIVLGPTDRAQASSPTARPTPCSAIGGGSSPPAACGFPASPRPFRPPPCESPRRDAPAAESPRRRARARHPVAGPLDLEVPRRRGARRHRAQRSGQVDARPDARGTDPARIRAGRGIRCRCRRA